MKFMVISFLLWIALFTFYLEQNCADARLWCGSSRDNRKKSSTAKGNKKSSATPDTAEARNSANITRPPTSKNTGSATSGPPISAAKTGASKANFNKVLAGLTSYCRTNSGLRECSQISANEMKKWQHKYKNQLIALYDVSSGKSESQAAYDALVQAVFTILDEIAKNIVGFQHLNMCGVPFSTQYFIFATYFAEKENIAVDDIIKLKETAFGEMKATNTYSFTDSNFLEAVNSDLAIGFELFIYYSDFKAMNGRSEEDVFEYSMRKYRERLLRYGKECLETPQWKVVFEKLLNLDFNGFVKYMIEKQTEYPDLKIIITAFAFKKQEEIFSTVANQDGLQKDFMAACTGL